MMLWLWPVQRAAINRSQIIAAKRDQSSIGLGNMDTAALKPIKIEAPDILEGHRRYGEGMGSSPVQETVEIILRVGHRDIEWDSLPLSGCHRNRFQGPIQSWLRAAIATGGTKPLQAAMFIGEILGRERAERMLTCWRMKIACLQDAGTLLMKQAD